MDPDIQAPELLHDLFYRGTRHAALELCNV